MSVSRKVTTPLGSSSVASGWGKASASSSPAASSGTRKASAGSCPSIACSSSRSRAAGSIPSSSTRVALAS